jgi:Protein of unknown function (DUF1194)
MKWAQAFAWGLAAMLMAAAATAAEPVDKALPVDTALVLVVDVSLSVNDQRYQLQKEGIAEAFENPDLADTIAHGSYGAVAVAVMEFSDPDRQFAVVEWTRVASSDDARRLAGQIRSVKRSSDGLTAIGDALLAAQELFDDSPFPATRRVIDVSGDGMSNAGTNMVAARDQVVAAGTTVNGLPILSEEPWLEGYYTNNVIGGPGAFVIVANGLDSFAAAMKRKLVEELAVSWSARPAARPAG